MADDRIHEDAAALAATVTELRRDLHRHPELGFREVRTARKISEYLAELGVEHRTGVAETGVLATIRGSGPGKTVALRADMDGLPIEERSENPARSENPGVMHACGHDGHVAILLGAASLLQARRKEFAGTIRARLPACRRGAPGAVPMLEQGALDDPRADAAFALHIWNSTPVRPDRARPGPVMAAADEFTIRVIGRGRTRQPAAGDGRPGRRGLADRDRAPVGRQPQRRSARPRGPHGQPRSTAARRTTSSRPRSR